MDRKHGDNKTSDNRTGEGTGNLGKILSGLTDLVEKLGELADKGSTLSKSGELDSNALGKGMKGVYGFSVRFGAGGDEAKVEPFGNLRKDKSGNAAIVHEIREPVVDVFEEPGYLQIVAELPGIGLNDIQVELHDDILELQATKGQHKYRKELLLPRACKKEDMQLSCSNGVLEIRIQTGTP